MVVGYARVSTQEQNLNRQIDSLKANGAEKIFEEKMTGTKADRPQLERMLDTLRSGDKLIVCDFSRLSRSTKDLIDLVERLNKMGVELVSLKENLDTTTATGKMMLTMISALVQFERDLIAERTAEGLKSARARGRVGGRKKVGSEAIKKKAIDLYNSNTMTNTEIAKFSGVSTATLSRWIKESKEGK